MKKYQVWHDEPRAEDYIVTVEVDTLEEAKGALRAFAAYHFKLNCASVEELKDKDPFEYTKDHALGGIMINEDGEFVDFQQDES